MSKLLPTSIHTRKLDRDERQYLRQLSLQWFNQKKLTAEEIWWNACMDFVQSKHRGADFLLKNVREAELKILQSETLSEEYISELINIMGADNISASEHQKLVLLLTATNDEREEAIKRVTL